MKKYNVSLRVEDFDNIGEEEIKKDIEDFLSINFPESIFFESIEEVSEGQDCYQGITHLIPEKLLNDPMFLETWGRNMCKRGVHAFDEVWSGSDGHYLSCDVCGMEVYISKIVKN